MCSSSNEVLKPWYAVQMQIGFELGIYFCILLDLTCLPLVWFPLVFILSVLLQETDHLILQMTHPNTANSPDRNVGATL